MGLAKGTGHTWVPDEVLIKSLEAQGANSSISSDIELRISLSFFKVYLFIYLFIYLFMYLFWERARACLWAGEGQRGRERIPSRLCTVDTGPDVALDLTDCEIMTWAEIKSRMLNRPSHPGTPNLESLKRGPVVNEQTTSHPQIPDIFLRCVL